MRLSARVQGVGEALMEAGDCPADGPDGLLGIILNPAEMFALEVVDVLDLLTRLRPGHFALVRVVHEGLKLPASAPQTAGGFGVVQAQVPLLNGGIALDDHGLGGGRVEDFGGRVSGRVGWAGPEGQGESVDGLLWWVEQEVRNVIDALLVFEDGLLAREGEVPKAEALAQGIQRGGLMGGWSIGVLE